MTQLLVMYEIGMLKLTNNFQKRAETMVALLFFFMVYHES